MNTTTKQLQVAIIGGGISGLSAAWELQKAGISYAVLEKSERWGGKVLTEQIDGYGDSSFVIEAGPDSFLTQKPWAWQLARELGLELLGTNDHQRSTYVLTNDKPVVIPDGVMLIVPTKFMPFALSPLISLSGKIRMGLDLFIPRKKDNADETLADFARRRLGSEALDKIVEPLMSGIYNAEAEKQSLLATFPRFRQLEQEHGSLIRGMLAARRKAPATQPDAPKSAFMSLYGGTQELIEALVSKLRGDLRLKTGVKSIQPLKDGGYQITQHNGETLQASTVIMTTPAYVTAETIRLFAPQIADELNTIRYVSTGTISLAFREPDIKRPLNGFGVVIPSSERRPINAITIASNKFDHRAPQGHALLRVFFGGSRSPQSMALDDDEVLKMACDQLQDILGIEAAPLFHKIYRWMNANPQYDLGHLEKVERIENGLPAGFYVTGSAYKGVGMPDCVYQSQQTVKRVVENLKVAEK